jgi:hypothetical protein
VASGTVTGPVTLQARLAWPPVPGAGTGFSHTISGCSGGSFFVDGGAGTDSELSFTSETCPVTAAGAGILSGPTVGVGDGPNIVPTGGLLYAVTAQVDPNNVTAESSETNNSFSQTVQIRP